MFSRLFVELETNLCEYFTITTGIFSQESMLTKPTVTFDLYVGVPIFRILTIG